MKTTAFFLVALLGLILVVCLGPIAGCEEVLEVCAPCASVEDGDVTISGDPRIDGTIDAIQAIRQFALQAEAAFARDKQNLAAAFGIDANAGISELAELIQDSLWVEQIVEVEIIRQPAKCWAEMDLADRAELSCETKLVCSNLPLSASTGERRPDCLGWFVGQCDGICTGTCYGKSAMPAICEKECSGTCVNDAPMVCPGKCYGNCSKACDFYSEEGECAGHCPGQCTGICASTAGFSCSGPCYGRCASNADGGVCEDGECHGTCTQTTGKDTPLGLCRGSVMFNEYDASCHDCALVAEILAWSRVYCEPALVQVAVRFLPGSLVQEVDKTALVHKATVLENALSRMATDQAKLSLLLDGYDDAGEMTAASLVPTFTAADPMPEYLEDPSLYAVDETRKFLPLDKLKARLGWISALATSGKFKLAAGVLPCVSPALEEARSILDQMLPTVQKSDSSADKFEVDRTCDGADAFSLAPCLFSLRDEQLTLLDLSAPGEQ